MFCSSHFVSLWNAANILLLLLLLIIVVIDTINVIFVVMCYKTSFRK